MNTLIKDKIIENELELLKFFPQYKQSIQQLIKKIEKSNTDGVLYGVLKSSLTGDYKKKQIDDYHKNGFISSFELISKNMECIDIDDKPSINSLIEEKKYNQYDICSLANNYNNQVGMYYLDNSSVIIKSTVEDNDRPYDDRWITKDVMLRYFMQSEKEECLKTLIFKNKPNVAIFSSLMEGNLINVYVFVNTKKRDDYTYKGVFHPCGIVCNNKAFILYKDGHENEIPFDNMDAQFICSLLKDNIYPDTGNINLVSVSTNTYKTNYNIKKMKQSKRNCIQQMQIQLEVDLRGEDLILKYEKNKLIKAGYKELADKVENVSLYDSGLGFDIKSYNVDSEGNVSEIYIKINSSVSENFNSFKLSDLELNNLNLNSFKYKLYRVYDIYTNKPKLQVIDTKNISSIFHIKPVSYEVSL